MKNFINYPYIKFSKTKLHNWARKKYILSENVKIKHIQDSYAKYLLLYKKNKELASNVLDYIYKFDPVNSSLYNLIKSFTLKSFDYISLGFLTRMFDDMGIEIKIVDEELFIKMGDLSFSIKKFSKVDPEILNQLVDIEEPERMGKCHPYSVLTALHYHKKKEYKTYLVTGRVYQFSPKAKYLHSWVEVEKDGKVYVIDPTRNLICLKSVYYFLNNVQEVVKISSGELENDFYMIKELTDYDNYAVKVYYENPENGRKLYKKLVKLGEIKCLEKDM